VVREALAQYLGLTDPAAVKGVVLQKVWKNRKTRCMPKGSEAASKCHAIIEVSEQQGIQRAHQTIEASFFS